MVDIGVLLLVIVICIVGANHGGKFAFNLFKYLCTLHQLTALVKGKAGCRLPKEQKLAKK